MMVELTQQAQKCRYSLGTAHITPIKSGTRSVPQRLTSQPECSPEAKERRMELFHSVLNCEAPEKGDVLLRALSSYGLAYDACLAQDADTWEGHLKQSYAAWAEVGNQPMLNFITQHRMHGCCTQSAMEMGGVMDGHELRFRDQTLSSMPKSNGGGRGGPFVASAAKGGDAAKASSGAKGVASSGAKAKATPVGPRPDTAAKQVEAELKAGYEMYQREECAPICDSRLRAQQSLLELSWTDQVHGTQGTDKG